MFFWIDDWELTNVMLCLRNLKPVGINWQVKGSGITEVRDPERPADGIQIIARYFEEETNCPDITVPIKQDSVLADNNGPGL